MFDRYFERPDVPNRIKVLIVIFCLELIALAFYLARPAFPITSLIEVLQIGGFQIGLMFLMLASSFLTILVSDMFYQRAFRVTVVLRTIALILMCGAPIMGFIFLVYSAL